VDELLKDDAQGRHEAAWSGEMVPFHVTEEE
jgi:hypothetical protein